MRTGVIAKKMGMTRLFQEDGRHVPVTVLALENVQVVARKEADATAMPRVQLGAGTAKAKNVAKPQRGHFGKAEVEPKARVAEFVVAEDALLDVGAELTADHFVAGQYVDIQGSTQGKGFPGRHEALGLRRPSRHPRRLALAPLARLDRPAPGSGPGLQEQEDGRPYGREEPHPAESRNRPHRRRARPDLRQGLGARPQGRLAAGQGRGQGAASRKALPIPPASARSPTQIEHEEAPAGMVEAAATHELPPLPGAEEVAAGVAESDAQAAECQRRPPRRPRRPTRARKAKP